MRLLLMATSAREEIRRLVSRGGARFGVRRVPAPLCSRVSRSKKKQASHAICRTCESLQLCASFFCLRSTALHACPLAVCLLRFGAALAGSRTEISVAMPGVTETLLAEIPEQFNAALGEYGVIRQMDPVFGG